MVITACIGVAVFMPFCPLWADQKRTVAGLVRRMHQSLKGDHGAGRGRWQWDGTGSILRSCPGSVLLTRLRHKTAGKKRSRPRTRNSWRT